jgi:hypothetical protein
MKRQLGMLSIAVALVGLAGCSSDNSATGGSGGTAPAGDNTIAGSVLTENWSTAANALWIDNGDANTTQTIFLFEKPMACSGIQMANWDKAAIGQLLEITLNTLEAKTYSVVYDPDAGGRAGNIAYLSAVDPNVNPNATSGSVTITNFVANESISGSFNATFPAPDTGTLTGTFKAIYCPGGTEP